MSPRTLSILGAILLASPAAAFAQSASPAVACGANPSARGRTCDVQLLGDGLGRRVAPLEGGLVEVGDLLEVLVREW